MTDIIVNQLSKITGTTVHYKGKDHFIERFKKISTGKIVVYTHIETFNFHDHEIEQFISELSEPKIPVTQNNKLEKQTSKGVIGYSPSAENVEIKATLMEMLAKVKANPENIPTAKAVCSIVKTMVDVQKTELEMIKIAQKL